MPVPFFYIESISSVGDSVQLDEDTSKHVIQVLRMEEGERIRLTDGKGNSAEALISDAHKKHTTAQVVSSQKILAPSPRLTIAISLVKNASRFEWFVEKATEFGVHEIIPMICERTERQKFRSDRMMGICKSAMLQSMQSWLPVLGEPQRFEDVIALAKQRQKMIAHCVKDAKVEFASLFNPSLETHIILIGPEGDFTPAEILLAAGKNFIPVSLGENRLRTETAGIFAAAWAAGAKEED
ncbi:MAG: 16S rRNA (uracil(1498)-N(3))-methyltransferase [Chitinophagaceae bacterium]|nr:16S rRNA (uracil(1498)-N(3))-methyltransferase [Chitinophagaceae bacterium]